MSDTPNNLDNPEYPAAKLDAVVPSQEDNSPLTSHKFNASLTYEKKESFENPFPSAAELERLHKIDPTLVERAFKLVESKSLHVQYMEKTWLNNSFAQFRRGQYFALLVAVMGMSWGAYFILKDHWIAGTIFGGLPLAALASIFIKQNWYNDKNDSEK